MVLILGLSLLVGLVVAVGLRRGAVSRHPGMQDRLSRIGQHLNGEADAPAPLVALYEHNSKKLSRAK